MKAWVAFLALTFCEIFPFFFLLLSILEQFLSPASAQNHFAMMFHWAFSKVKPWLGQEVKTWLLQMAGVMK